MQRVITFNLEETQQFAEKLAESLKVPTIITLQGILGVGKTSFTQGFARGLGIKQKITSPTFIIMRKYDLYEGKIETFYHVDLYRLETEKEIEGTGLMDVLRENNSIVVIEWPEKMGSLLPSKRIDINLNYLSEMKREIIVEDISK